MAGFALDLFERQAEGFLRARLWREFQFVTDQRPGRALRTLYDEDFKDFTSTDLWNDLQSAQIEDPGQHKSLSALFAASYLEGHTREYAARVTRVEGTATVLFEDHDIAWREAPAHWLRLPEVPRRHELDEGWRGVLRTDLNPILERWHEALRAQLVPLGADDWLGFWSGLRGFDLGQLGSLADSVLQTTADVYGHGLSVYLNQLGLPIDDAWTCDVDWAFRAPRFDAVFLEGERMPQLIRTFRDLGIELEEQTSVHLEYARWPGVRCLPLDVPSDVRVLQRLVGGWQDVAHSLRGLGMAQHLVHTDPTLGFGERWLGDETPTIGYGLLMESLLRDKTWLATRLEYLANDDFRAIAYLAWLYRIRGLAASAQYEQRLWQAEPGGSISADFEEALSGATRVRHFTDQYLSVLIDAPWSTLRSATWLRAEVFAAQLRAFLQREYDEEWWRSPRAARFLKDELWRPGRRHTAEELLSFMGYPASSLTDPSILATAFEAVLLPL